MTVVVVVLWPWCAARAAPGRPRAQDARADGDDEQSRGRLSHGYRSSGRTYRESVRVTRPEREDADRVGDRDGEAEREGVARRAARADEVRGDHRLAVAGRERVEHPPRERAEEEDEQDPAPVGGPREDAGEAVARAVPRRAAAAPRRSGALTVPAAGRDREPRRAHGAGL